MEGQPSQEKMLLSQILRKYHATDMKDLHLRVYMLDDQEHMKSLTWDYATPSITNSIYNDCLKIETGELSEEDEMWLRETLYFWNHHAISCAIWRHKDLEAALRYSVAALGYQDSDHPNHVTRLFKLLLEKKEKEAAELVEIIPDDGERETARDILESYRNGWSDM